MLIFLFVWGVISAWLVGNFIISFEIIKGNSMYPTLMEGDSHLVNKFIYCFREPSRGDIVIIRNIWQKESQVIKRVIGVPGDVIAIRRGQVYLNSEPLREQYAKGQTYPPQKPLTIGEDSYYILGDNRKISYDSRECGLIERRHIRGKLVPDRLFTLQ